MEKFVAIEGLDACGKSTQISLLTQYLASSTIEFKYIHFPRTDTAVYGELIASFLRGEFGNVNSVNPYLVALLYAGDRENAKPLIQGWLSRGYLVLVDRYVYSNIAFQCAKIDKLEEKEKLKKWLTYLEYDYNKIPAPNISIFLHVPLSFITRKLADKRNGSDRFYLNGKQDIHESSLKLQKKVETEYLRLASMHQDFYIVNCYTKNDEILPPEKIHSEIINILNSKSIIET